MALISPERSPPVKAAKTAARNRMAKRSGIGSTSREMISRTTRIATVSSGPPHWDQNLACRAYQPARRCPRGRSEGGTVMAGPPTRPEVGLLVPLWPSLFAVRRLRRFLKGLRVRGWAVFLDPLLRHCDREVLGIPFGRKPLLWHGQIDVPLSGIGRLTDGCHSRPVAVGHLLGRDGDVVAAVSRHRLSLNHGVTSPEELDAHSAFT